MLSAMRETLEHADGFSWSGPPLGPPSRAARLAHEARPRPARSDAARASTASAASPCCASAIPKRPSSCSQAKTTRVDREGAAGRRDRLREQVDHPADIPVVLRQALDGTVHFASPQVSRVAVAQAARQSQVTQARQRGGSDRARARDPRSGGPRPLEPRRRQGAVPLRPNREVPPAQDLPQAQGDEPHRSDADGLRPWASSPTTSPPSRSQTLCAPRTIWGPAVPAARLGLAHLGPRRLRPVRLPSPPCLCVSTASPSHSTGAP